MRIVVLLKEVPDTYGDRHLDLETGLADRDNAELVLDEINERGLEVALSHADDHADTEITVISMSHEGATATIRRGLAMGASGAVHIADETLVGADARLTAEVLAAAIGRQEFDLVIAGNKSTDGSGGVVPGMVAELLGVASLTGLSEVNLTADSVSGVRPVEGGVQEVSAALPAVISITEALPDARFPNFKSIMAAKKKPIDVLSLADLDVEADPAQKAASIMLSVAEKPPRAEGVKVVDEGDAGQQLADFLVENRLV